MAAAEARAAWQRTANRCFVQEDAKRAPKLACCPSSGATTKQVDSGPESATTDVKDHCVPGFVPFNNNTSYTNVPPDTRWWLHLQPNYGYQRNLSNEQLNNLEAEMDILGAGFASLNVKSSQVHLKNTNVGSLIAKSLNSDPYCPAESRVSASFMKKEPRVKNQELKAVYTKNIQEPVKTKDGEESYEFIEMDHVDSSGFKTFDEPCFDSGSPLIGSGKRDPWWKTADSGELASFVAQRSLDLIENCDLPQPQKTDTKRSPYAHVGYSDRDESINLSVDRKPQTAAQSSPSIHSSGNSTPGVIDRPISYGTTKIGQVVTQNSDKDSCKAQLLEALRHSQTRAREAEMAAKQAYAEKEHIVKLFFRQASQLFAYKQWLQLLQLENLYFQIKNNKNHPMSALFPAVLPWTPLKNRKMRKNLQKAAKGKDAQQGRPGCCNIRKYTLMFALGLSLVGAGLFLGWTMGWMFPAL